jgi:NADH-quinone oxidoreductase subunit A
MEIFIPLLLMFTLVLGLLIVMLLMNRLLAPHHPTPVKNQAFECGNTPTKLPEGRNFVRFYLVAILFILFDIELAFLFPWAVVFRELGFAGFSYMMVFLGVLMAGFVYVWKRGALELQ